jgi:hypothetical protein
MIKSTRTVKSEKLDDFLKIIFFYSEPLTLEEKNIIFKKSSTFSDLTVIVDLIIMNLLVNNDKVK